MRHWVYGKSIPQKSASYVLGFIWFYDKLSLQSIPIDLRPSILTCENGLDDPIVLQPKNGWCWMKTEGFMRVHSYTFLSHGHASSPLIFSMNCVWSLLNHMSSNDSHHSLCSVARDPPLSDSTCHGGTRPLPLPFPAASWKLAWPFSGGTRFDQQMDGFNKHLRFHTHKNQH